MYKVYAIDQDQRLPVKIGGTTGYIDDAIAQAEMAFEYLQWADRVEVFQNDKFGPVARVSDNGIHELTPAY